MRKLILSSFKALSTRRCMLLGLCSCLRLAESCHDLAIEI